jgi:hypothetical protein
MPRVMLEQYRISGDFLDILRSGINDIEPLVKQQYGYEYRDIVESTSRFIVVICIALFVTIISFGSAGMI